MLYICLRGPPASLSREPLFEQKELRKTRDEVRRDPGKLRPSSSRMAVIAAIAMIAIFAIIAIIAITAIIAIIAIIATIAIRGPRSSELPSGGQDGAQVCQTEKSETGVGEFEPQIGNLPSKLAPEDALKP